MPQIVAVSVAATGSSESKMGASKTVEEEATEATTNDTSPSSSADAVESENQEKNNKHEKVEIVEKRESDTMGVDSVSESIIAVNSSEDGQPKGRGGKHIMTAEDTSESKHECNEKKGEESDITSMDVDDSKENSTPAADKSKEEANEKPPAKDNVDEKAESIEHKGMLSIGEEDEANDVSEIDKPNEIVNGSNNPKDEQSDEPPVKKRKQGDTVSAPSAKLMGGSTSTGQQQQSIGKEGEQSRMASIGETDVAEGISENNKSNEDGNERNKKQMLAVMSEFDKKDFNAGLFQFVLSKAQNGGKADPKGNAHLRAWINYQNSCLKGPKTKGAVPDLTKAKIVVLDELDFPWKLSRDERWNENFQDLVKFHKENGNCRVPRSACLGEWVSNQRKGMKLYVKGGKSHLTKEEAQLLDSIDFEYDLNDWNGNYLKLCLFAKDYGHCSVPRDFAPLGRWVIYQRELYRKLERGEKSTMTKDRIKKLEEVAGFKWVCRPG